MWTVVNHSWICIDCICNKKVFTYRHAAILIYHLCHMICFRLRARSKPSHHASGFSEPLKAIDSTKLPPEDGGGDCIELNECDETQSDKDNENDFKDTTPTG